MGCCADIRRRDREAGAMECQAAELVNQEIGMGGCSGLDGGCSRTMVIQKIGWWIFRNSGYSEDWMVVVQRIGRWLFRIGRWLFRIGCWLFREFGWSVRGWIVWIWIVVIRIMDVRYRQRLMKSAGCQELMGQKNNKGHIIHADKADADNEFFVIE